MSFGLPVIASDVGGVSEIVDNSVGYLIKRGDKEGLKRALKELIDSKAIRLEKGNNARKRIEESFTLDKMLSKTEQVYLQ
ncbi:MAG: D-inositol-3-phosphate glycosyltransferase [Parcubacteria group bacterium ADurb.Bin247]|jgi:glycosyltransferase involved in cell wall biosynthesis|nr:MAG: D-inositol-3-phosphate glycosyltransferase [Parcubacteria group bacterium ADurb.Bin247]